MATALQRLLPQLRACTLCEPALPLGARPLFQLDRRAPILSVTPEGQAEYQRMLPIRAGFHRGLTEDMTPEDRETLDALLAQIARKLGKLAEK